jgi:hypothetical protein
MVTDKPQVQPAFYVSERVALHVSPDTYACDLPKSNY